MKACYVSCGAEHCILLDQDEYVPHAWGDNANYRCGQKQLGLYEEPTPVKPFPKLFKQENINKQQSIAAYQASLSKGEKRTYSEIKGAAAQPKGMSSLPGMRPLKYRVQYDLKFQNHISIKPDELVKQDTLLQLQFNKTVLDFH